MDPAVGVAGRCVTAAEVELRGLPAAPRGHELGHGLARTGGVRAPGLEIVAMPSEVRHQAENLELGSGDRLAARRDQLVGRDARLVFLRGRVDRSLREVRALLQLEVARPHPEAHLRRPPEVARHGTHQIDLANAVERHPSADRHCLLEQRARLAGAVDGDQLRRHPAGQRGVQLGRPEDVAAEALLREGAAQRERVVGLDRGQGARRPLGPGSSEGAGEAPRVAAQVILRDDRERRAEAPRER